MLATTTVQLLGLLLDFYITSFQAANGNLLGLKILVYLKAVHWTSNASAG